MAKKQENSEKKSFLSRFKKTSNLPVEKELSSAKKTKKPQISPADLSHAGMHLLLLIQHEVDQNKIQVVNNQHSWEVLESTNPCLSAKKKHIKELCNVHHFSQKEKNLIALRVCLHVEAYQPENVLENAPIKKKIII